MALHGYVGGVGYVFGDDPSVFACVFGVAVNMVVAEVAQCCEVFCDVSSSSGFELSVVCVGGGLLGADVGDVGFAKPLGSFHDLGVECFGHGWVVTFDGCLLCRCGVF